MTVSREKNQKMEAVREALYKATGVSFLAVDHGMVTSFYGTVPFLPEKPVAENTDAFFRRVYEGIKDQIDRFDLTGYNDYPADPTSFYGAQALGHKKDAFCFEFRFPFGQMEYPPEVLAEIAGAVGKIIAPEAKRGMEASMKHTLPRTVQEDLQAFLKTFRGPAPGPSYN